MFIIILVYQVEQERLLRGKAPMDDQGNQGAVLAKGTERSNNSLLGNSSIFHFCFPAPNLLISCQVTSI